MLIIIFLFGLCVGSFANVLIDRLPCGEDVFGGRSRCDFCKKNLRWFELIPMVSFFIQRGRCRRCHKKLSWQYPLVELATGFLFLGIITPSTTDAAWTYRYIEAIGSLLIGFSLLVIFVSDFIYEIIPDSMIILGVIGGIGARGGIGGIGENVLAGIGAAAFFFFLFLITSGRGMGFGDVKLVFLLGVILGFPNILIALYAAFLTGAAVGIILMIGGKKTFKSHIPFGPFLILGTVFALLYGNQAVEWWSRLL